MSEFKIVSRQETDTRREYKVRLLTWGSVVAVAVIALASLYAVRFSNRELDNVLIVLVVVLMTGAIVGGPFFAARLGLERLERDLVFELTDTEMIRRRRGFPDIRIGLSEIDGLHERSGWLVVESSKPRRMMAIPEALEGFDVLRAELLKHCSIVAKRQRSLLDAALLLVSLFCWGILLWSRSTVAGLLAAISALVLLGWESLRLHRLLRHGSQRSVLWFLIGSTWAVAALVIYLRISRSW
jgi:hypothetical protein